MTIPRALPALLAAACLSALPAAAGKADQARRQIIEADTLFARTLKDGDLERFKDFISRDTLFFGAGVHDGREAVVEAWSVYFRPGSRPTLAWEPVRAEVASSGDLGYTAGSYVLTTFDDGGAATERHGAYVTIWRREKDGRWRAVLDIGTPPGAEPLAIPAN